MTSRIFSKASLVIACLVLLVFTLPVIAGPAPTGTTSRVSLSTAGVQTNNHSMYSVVSANGKFVAFVSDATNLVDDDTNGVGDIFVRNLATGVTERVNVSSTNVEANGASSQPAISADGRYVVFTSTATNLVASDANAATDVFIRDRVAGTTELVSVSSASEQGNSDSSYPSINANGTVVAFESFANNLVANDNNNTSDIFVRNITGGTTERVSVSSTGVEGNYDSHSPSVNSDGTRVAFYSYADNLVDNDTNILGDVFVKYINTGLTVIASVSSAGVLGDGSSIKPAISGNGKYVAFQSSATNLVPGDANGLTDIFVRDIQSNTTDIVSLSSAGVQANLAAQNTTISSDGRFITFASMADNLVAGDTNAAFDVFVRDTFYGTTERVSVSTGDGESNNGSDFPSISADGRFVTFMSYATNLVVDDTNDMVDIFLRDRALAPANTSLTPDAGNITVDQKVTLTSTYTDALGASNIRTCYLLVNPTFSMDSGYMFYNAVKNKLYLRPAGSTTLIGGYAPGKAYTIDNGFMVLNCALTTVTKVGNVMTIKWVVTFKPGFAGSTCNAWMRVTNIAEQFDPWEQMGTFTMIGNPAPVNVSLTPDSGSINTNSPTTLTSVYSDPAGFDNIRTCYMMVNTGATTSGAGYCFYDPIKNKLYLRQTGSSALIGGFAPGSAHVIDNGSMTLNCLDTSVVKAGNELTVNWNITLKSYFDGNPCTVSMQVTNKTGQSDPWQAMGTFDVLGGPI